MPTGDGRGRPPHPRHVLGQRPVGNRQKISGSGLLNNLGSIGNMAVLANLQFVNNGKAHFY